MRVEERAPAGALGWLRRANKKVLLGGLIVIAVVGVLMGTQLRGALTYYLTVDELLAKGDAVYGDRVRVGGRVQAGSIRKDADNNLSFVIYHGDTRAGLPVQYRGIVPDLFRDEGDVIAEGVWQRDGVFRATNLLAQHPPEFKVAEPGKPHQPVKDRSGRS